MIDIDRRFVAMAELISRLLIKIEDLEMHVEELEDSYIDLQNRVDNVERHVY